MFKLFGERRTTRTDVAFAITGAIMAAFKAYDTTSKYKAEKKAELAKESK